MFSYALGLDLVNPPTNSAMVPRARNQNPDGSGVATGTSLKFRAKGVMITLT